MKIGLLLQMFIYSMKIQGLIKLEVHILHIYHAI